MKLSAVYRSTNRANTYLYVAKRDDFEAVPNALMAKFGKPKFVMLLAIQKHPQVAGIDKQAFIKKLREQGFYLQIPPKEKNWLGVHRESIGLDATIPSRPSYSDESFKGKTEATALKPEGKQTDE